MPNFRLMLLAFVCLSCSFWVAAETVTQSGFEYHIQKTADWITPVKIENNSSPLQEAGASWLLSDTQILLNENKHARFHHYAVKVNLENGLRDASEFSIYFQPDFQTLDINFVKRYRSGKAKDLTQLVDIRLLQREESYSQGIYDGGVTAMLLLNDVQVGDTVEFAYTINGRNPIFKNEYFSGFPINWSSPVKRMFAKLTSDKPLNYKVYNAAIENLKSTESQGKYFYTWDKADVAGVYDEGEYPGWYDPYASVRFSQYKSWAGVVDWALELYQVADLKNPTLIALSDQWAKQSKTKKEYVEKVIRYAQNNIRYFGIEIGQNSHQPYTPDMVFERKYGDCKDKTMFINTLLARQGIKAYPALVSSRSTKAVEDLLPQPGAFDHVISTFQLDGKDYWIDGTREFQFGSLDNIGVSDFQRALVVKQGNKELTQVNAQSLNNGLKLSEVYNSTSYQQPVELVATFEYRYARAEGMRAFLKSEGINNFSKSFINFYAKRFPAIVASERLKIDDDEVANRMTITGVYQISDFWKTNKSDFEVDLYGDIIAEYVVKPSVIARTSPFYNSHPITLEHQITLNYTDSVDWNLADTDINISTDAIGYQRKVEYSESSIQVTHQFQSKKDYVAADEITNYLEKADKIRKAIYYSVSIANNEFKNPESEDLKSRLKRLLKKNRD